jgi:hypothetical protein
MSAKHVLEIYTKLHANKIGAHWIWTALERIANGESEYKVIPDYGYTDQADRLAVLEREHQEFFDKWHEHRRALDAIVQVLGPTAPTCDGCAAEIAEALKIARKVGADKDQQARDCAAGLAKGIRSMAKVGAGETARNAK